MITMIAQTLVVVALLVSGSLGMESSYIAESNTTVGTGKVLWHQNQQINIVESTRIANGKFVVSGWGYNYDPGAIMQVNTLNTGASVWSFKEEDFTVSAADTTDLIAGISFNDTLRTTTLYLWHSSSSTPFYTYQIPGQTTTIQDNAVTVSKNGKVVVAVVNRVVGSSVTPRVYYVSTTTSPPTIKFVDTKPGAFAVNAVLSDDGTIVTVDQDSDAFVYDFVTQQVRANFAFPSDTTTICMSGDGQYVAHGFTFLRMLQWSSVTKTYKEIFAIPGAGNFYTGACAISDDYKLAVSWVRFDYHQNRVSLFQIVNNNYTSLWQYSFTPSPVNDQYQDGIFALSMTPDGQFLAGAAWGNQHKTSPTISVWKTSTSYPAFTLISPGSMNDIDVKNVNGVAYVASGGKNVHNNDMGDGGDLYSIMVQ